MAQAVAVLRLDDRAISVRVMRRGRKLRSYQKEHLSSFEFGLMVLKRYVRQHGHARVPVRYRDRGMGHNLGFWVANQRRKYRCEQLSPEHVRALKGVRGWAWNLRAPVRVGFEAAMAALRDFAARNGHCRPGRKDRVGRFSLGNWVVEQRRAYAAGQLDRSRIRALRRIPGWSWKPHDARFEKGLRVLRTFARKHGHVRIPDEPVDGFGLASWVVRRRGEYRRGQLSPDRRRQLDAIPHWTWSPYEDRFELGLALLKRYAKRAGQSRPPERHLEQGFPLGRWVQTRRERREALSASQRRRLEMIPGWTWATRRRGRE